MSVALAVCGAIVLMAGVAAVLAGEVRRVEPAGGWQSLVSLGVVLIAGGFGLGAAFAVVTTAGLRGGGRPTGRESFPAEPEAAGPELAGLGLAGPGLAGPGPAEPVVAPSVAAPADGIDERGRPEGFVWAGDPAPAPPPEPARREDWDELDEAPQVAASGGDNTKAEDWLSHLRGAGVGPVQQARQSAPPESFAGPSASPAAASYGPPMPADYADEGWQLDGAEWGQEHPAAPEVHHPTAGRRHDTGQWRAFGLDQEPP